MSAVGEADLGWPDPDQGVVVAVDRLDGGGERPDDLVVILLEVAGELTGRLGVGPVSELKCAVTSGRREMLRTLRLVGALNTTRSSPSETNHTGFGAGASRSVTAVSHTT